MTSTLTPETTGRLTRDEVMTALDVVLDPELDEPITDLGFVQSVTFRDDDALEVHLRLPTSFCSPSFAYLMVSDAKDVLTALVSAADHDAPGRGGGGGGGPPPAPPPPPGRAAAPRGRG
ncbi:iron-sulfur cluster assembly protein, partial [Nocardioides sp. CFH 31398]|uniref:iron-sulfur cluster assembly protein n=1 Tax=Nocardioides sp. CFH 31398 TaxID=2919579 RepID=UPI001F05D3AD